MAKPSDESLVGWHVSRKNVSAEKKEQSDSYFMVYFILGEYNRMMDEIFYACKTKFWMKKKRDFNL